MPTLKGREAEQRRRDQAPDKMKRILRGAARAGATVIADDAMVRVTSDAVRDGVTIGRAKEQEGQIRVRITVEAGWARSLGTWLEWGTEGHFITVDSKASGGRTAARVNKLGEDGPGGTLIINGKPVGATVWHPGARPHPWLSVARDTKAREAVQAAQEHINARVRRSGMVEDDE